MITYAKAAVTLLTGSIMGAFVGVFIGKLVFVIVGTIL